MSTKNKHVWRESWFLRKAAYAVAAVVLLVAVGAGWITQEIADTWLAQAEQIITLLGALGLGVASAKTHRGSDDKATTGDVTEAAKNTSGLGDVLDKVGDLRDRINDLRAGMDSTPQRVADEVVRNIPQPVPAVLDTTTPTPTTDHPRGGIYPAGQ